MVKVWSLYLFADKKQAIEEEIKSASYTNKIISNVIIGGAQGTKITGGPLSETTASYSPKENFLRWLSKVTGAGTPENQKGITVVFSKGNYIYAIESGGVNIKTFKAMLSTFNFLE